MADTEQSTLDDHSVHECPECGREFDSKSGLGAHRGHSHENPWQDADELERLYIEEGLSLSEIADRFECASGTVRNHIKSNGIETREKGVPGPMRASGGWKEFVGMYMDSGGYVQWNLSSGRDRGKGVSVHRLLAVAEYGFETVAYETDHVHHKNGIPWDNRPDNIVPLTAGEHRRVHNEADDGEFW